MPDLRTRFDQAGRMPAPDLWQDIETRRPGPLVRRTRPAGAVAVALAVTALGLTIAALAFWPRTEVATPLHPTPSASSNPSSGLMQFTRVRFDFIPVRVVKSSRSLLVVDAPARRARWSFHGQGCTVDAHPLGGNQGGGGFNGGCGGDAYLQAGGAGGLSVGGRFYSVAVGRALPIAGYRVRVTLGDGRSASVTPLNGLWFVVTGGVEPPYRAIPDQASEIRRVELLDPDGRVVSSQDIPPRPYP